MPLTNSQLGWRLKKVTATGLALGKGQVFGGIMCPTVGTSTTIAAYDDTSAAAANLLFPATATLTAGQFINCCAGVCPITVARDLSDGIILNTGLWLVFGGTGSPVFWVLYK